MSYLCYLCLSGHSGVQHIFCCVFVLLVCFRLVYSILHLSLGCSFPLQYSLLSPSVFSTLPFSILYSPLQYSLLSPSVFSSVY
jgi:hypothetical protein